jgi:sulfur relay (sulfurtransferase) DsrC/TusE family protein
LKGSFDKFVIKGKGKRGTSTVDKEFLEEIERWRKNLATYIARQNRELGTSEVNFAVQRIIDRILFLRMCEDRGIEQYGQLMALKNGKDVYRRLGELFEKADAKYNSGLFYFKYEKGRNEPPDELTLGLIDA